MRKKEEKKKRLTYQDIKHLADFLSNILQITKIYYTTDIRGKKEFIFYTKKSKFTVGIQHLFNLNKFLKAYLNWHRCLPDKVFKLYKYKKYFPVIANELIKQAVEVEDMGKEVVLDKIFNCFMNAQVVENIDAILNDFIILVRYEDKLIFSFLALKNTLQKLYDTNLRDKELAEFLHSCKLAKKFKRLLIHKFYVRTWVILNEEILNSKLSPIEDIQIQERVDLVKNDVPLIQ